MQEPPKLLTWFLKFLFFFYLFSLHLVAFFCIIFEFTNYLFMILWIRVGLIFKFSSSLKLFDNFLGSLICCLNSPILVPFLQVFFPINSCSALMNAISSSCSLRMLNIFILKNIIRLLCFHFISSELISCFNVASYLPIHYLLAYIKWTFCFPSHLLLPLLIWQFYKLSRIPRPEWGLVFVTHSSCSSEILATWKVRLLSPLIIWPMSWPLDYVCLLLLFLFNLSFSSGSVWSQIGTIG